MATITQVAEERNLWDAMLKGVRCRCPKCGEGKLFRSYLKVNETCPHCGEALYHHRADDLPPYIAIMIVGHLLVGIMLHLELVVHISALTYLYTMLPMAVILPLVMLPSIKGAVVGLQWAHRMHGFAPGHEQTEHH